MDSSHLPNIPDNMSQQFSSALKKAQEIAQKLRSNAPLSKMDPTEYSSSSLDSSTLAKVQQIASSISSKHNITGLSGNVDENEEVNDTMLIPASVAGLVIGKGGDTIRMLQERAQCRMFMVQDGIYANGPDKLLTFGGSRIRVEEAKKLVRDFLDDKDGLLKGIPNLSPGWVRNELTVPRESVGLIIGRGGETIKKINVDTNCRVYFRVLDNNTPGDRVCIFEGLPEDIENAVMRVREIVALALRKNGIRIQQILLPDGYSIEEIPVKSHTANQIITRNNEYIKGVIAATGANIELNKGIDSTVSRNFIVFGLPEQIKHVREMFESRVGAENVLPSVQPTNCQIQRIPNQPSVAGGGFQMPNMGGYPTDPHNPAVNSMMPAGNQYDPSAALYTAMNQQGIYSEQGMMNHDPNAAAMNQYNNQDVQNPDSNVNDAWNAYYAQINQQQQLGTTPAAPLPATDETNAAWASYYSQMSQQLPANPNPNVPNDQTAWNGNYQATEATTSAAVAPGNAQVTVEQATAWAEYYDQVYQQNLVQGGDQTTAEQALAWAKYYRDMIPLLGNSQDKHPDNNNNQFEKENVVSNQDNEMRAQLTTNAVESVYLVDEKKDSMLVQTTEPSLNVNNDDSVPALGTDSDKATFDDNLNVTIDAEKTITDDSNNQLDKSDVEKEEIITAGLNKLIESDQVETEQSNDIISGTNEDIEPTVQIEQKNEIPPIVSQDAKDCLPETDEDSTPSLPVKTKKETSKVQRKRRTKKDAMSNDEIESDNTDLKNEEAKSTELKVAETTVEVVATPGKGRGRRGRPPKNPK